MKLDEALKAAERGFKVAPMGKHGYFVYHSEGMGFRRVKVSKYGHWDEPFDATPYEKMMNWQIYDKNPFAILKDFVKRVFEKTNPKLSSNPA